MTIGKRQHAFIFDMDGTIVDNMDLHREIWYRFFSNEGITPSPAELHARTSGKTNAEILRDFFGEHITEVELAKYSERKEEMYRSIYTTQIKAVPGLCKFLRKAKELGISLALATSSGERNINFVLDNLGIRSYFPIVVGAEDVRHGKPDPEIFLTAAQRLQIMPESCTVFEDSLAGLEAARRAGMRSIAIATTHTTLELAHLPTVMQVISDYESLEPDAILQRLEQTNDILPQGMNQERGVE